MYHLDDLDVRIIRELGSPSSPQWNVRESYSRIGRKLGVDEETVRKRLKRAKDAGLLPGWRMRVNPHALGYEAAYMDLETRSEQDKDVAVPQVRLVQGVVHIIDFYRKGMQLMLYAESDEVLRKKVELINSVSRPTVSKAWNLPFPKIAVKMKALDWEIIRVMQSDARMDLREVAEAIGGSVRTVQRRLEFLKDNRVTYLVGTPDIEKVSGVICNFLVSCPDGAKKAAMDRTVSSNLKRLDFSSTASKEYSVFVVSCENHSDAERTLRWLRSLEGVQSVRMGIMKGFIVVEDWFKEEVARAANRSERRGVL